MFIYLYVPILSSTVTPVTLCIITTSRTNTTCTMCTNNTILTIIQKLVYSCCGTGLRFCVWNVAICVFTINAWTWCLKAFVTNFQIYTSNKYIMVWSRQCKRGWRDNNCKNTSANKTKTRDEFYCALLDSTFCRFALWCYTVTVAKCISWVNQPPCLCFNFLSAMRFKNCFYCIFCLNWNS